MKNAYPHVFSPLTIRGVTFKNRLEMTPSSPGLMDYDGFMTAECAEFFRPIARGGAGVITIGNAIVDWAVSHDEERQLRLDTDDTIQPLTRFVDMCRQYGCEPSIEVNHTGADANFDITGNQMVSASPCVSDFERMRAAAAGREPIPAREMTTAEVKATIQKYIDGALRCKKAGVKRVMIHGGHANLIGQFSSPHFNHRTDEYGGSFENRIRFAVEILDGVRAACGEDFVIEFRVSADEMVEDGMHFEETKKYLLQIADKIDIVNVSAGIRGLMSYMRYWFTSYCHPHMGNVAYAAELRRLLPESVKVGVVSAIMNLENAEKILAEGAADIVCLTRPLYADPEMPRKTAAGKADLVRPCLRCNYCATRLAVHATTQCAVNPLLGRQAEFPGCVLTPAPEKKRVAVVGGGPAGLEAAETLRLRGHEVTLYEATDRLGGSLQYAVGIQPLKQDLAAYLRYILRRAEVSGVRILLNHAPTAEELEQEAYDAVILACGADPAFPPVPGTDLPHVHWAALADAGEAEVKGRVVIVGVGSMGLETAYGLVKKGVPCTVIGMEKTLDGARGGLNGGLGGAFAEVVGTLREAGTEILTDHTLREITAEGVRCVNGATGGEKLLPADTVLLATGLRPRRAVVEALRGCAPATEVWVVGDAKEPANVAHAVHSAFDAACAV